MKLIFIGSGSAFTLNHNYQSNMILESDSGKNLLIDCGSDARFALNDLGYTYKDIDSVYISHLHADHVGGLEWLSFSTKFDKECKKPKLFVSERIASDLWDHVLAGGLSSLQGNVANLSTYFNIHKIPDNGCFTWEEIPLRIIQTIHIMSGFSIIPSYGLLFKANGLRIFLTTDTQFAPSQIMDFYLSADLIFHDCETSDQISGVHAHYNELKKLDPKIKRKMWLYHYNPGALPDSKKDGFCGFVKKGQVFDFSAGNLLS